MPPRRARTRARRKARNAVLRKVKPSLVPVPVELSQDSLVPDACLPTTPPKKKEALSFSPLSLPAKKGRRPLDPPPSPGKAKRPATQLTAARAVGSPQATPSPHTRKRRSLYEFRPEEFVEVVSPVKKQRILTEHQREVRKERRSLPALYSNLSQSNLESQDSEETPQSEDMDATEPALDVPEETKPNGFPAPAQQSGDGTSSVPVIILDSDEGEENEPLSSSASLLPGREACRTPPLQELLPENTAGDAAAMSTTVVPETQQDDTPCAAATPLLETPKGQSLQGCSAVHSSTQQQQPPASGSPRVHRPKAKLSFARSSTVVVEESPEEGIDVVPSSQSTTDSAEETQPVAKPSQPPETAVPLEDPHPDSPARVWLQDKDSGRLVASQDSPSPQRKSNRRRRKSSLARAQEETDALLARGRRPRSLLPDSRGAGQWQDAIEDSIAPLADDELVGSPADSEAQVHKDTVVVDDSATEEQTQVGTVDDESEPASGLPSSEAVATEEVGEPTLESETDVQVVEHSSGQQVATTASSDDGASEVCSLRLSEGDFSSALSDVPEPAVQEAAVREVSPEFGEPLSEDTEVVATQLAADTERQPGSSEEEQPGAMDTEEGHACTVPETEDNTGVAPEVPQGAEIQCEVPQAGIVKGARKRKLPSQATSPIASRLRAKQARQQEHGSPPSAGAASRPPRWAAGSPAALSRSRIMVDAAMRSVGGSSPSSRHSPSNGHARQAADGGQPVSILKRQPPPGSSSPQQPKQSGRHVSFADPPVQGECEIKEYKRSFSRALYEEPELDEGELVDSQLPVWPALESNTDPVDAILPFLASSLWQRSLGRRLRQQGLCTVGSLASLTAAQALQLPLRAPRVASLRTALQQYANTLEGEDDENPLPPAAAFSSKQALAPPVVAAAVEESCNGLATPEVALCDMAELSSQEEEEEEEEAPPPAAADATAAEAIIGGSSSTAATPSLDLEEDEALPCGQQQQATCQERDVPEESAAVVAEEITVAALVSPSSSCDAASQTAEPRTLCSTAVQCKASTTVVGSQTGPVVLSKQEVCQLLTPDFFASLERADLGHILATIATVVAADHRTTGFIA